MKKTFVSIASRLFPGLVTNYAYHQLTHPQVRKLRDWEVEVLEQASQKKFRFREFDIQTYFWKGGDKRVLLIHGWEGQAGNFATLIPALTRAGFDVYAFDGPSHGLSSGGSTSLFEFVELVQVLIERYKVQHLISHSFGGVATISALSEIPGHHIRKYLLFTTPDRFSQRIDAVAEMTGISEGVKQRLIQRLADETGMDPLKMNVSSIVRGVNVDEALILHDEEDRVIPIYQSESVQANWSNSILEPVRGTGHFRILRDEAVIKRGLEFLLS